MAERDPISGSSRDYGSTAAPPAVDFSPTELFNLSENIADNINSISIGLRSLEKMMKQIGGPNDNVQLRDKIHETQQAVNASVSAAARSLPRLAAPRADRARRLQAERLAQAFRDALATYTTVQKAVSEKMSAHMPRAKRPRRPPTDEDQVMAEDDEAELLDNQQAQARLVQFETSMLLEREAYMNQIEADVLDVNQIMKELSVMVNVQGQAVDSVASHIENADARVEAGVEELAKAAEHQRRYRRKMVILGAIVAILLIVFIVWVVRAFR